MGPGKICILVLCIFLYFQDTLQAKAKKCRRTNKKPYRYCLDRRCTRDSNCRPNERCLCDGDCGLSCVRNGTDCGRPASPKGLRVRLSDGTKFGSIASFSCRGDQYTLRGSRKRVCRGIGKWDGKDAKCRILCKHPGDIAYGNNDGDKKNYRVGSTIRYWCFPGYDMEGKSAMSCNNRGKWSTPKPKCAAPTCSKPTPPDNSFIFSRRKLKDKYKFNEVIRFRCEYGYYTSGSSFQRCLASGWSNTNFRCIPKSCGDPGSPINGKREGYVFTFKKKVYFKCNRGYMRVGPEYRQCQSNQKWSDKTPTCEPIDCGRLPDPQYGEKIEETSTTFGGKVAFQCKKTGFELKGPAERTCQENGKWSGTRTTCEPVECKHPGLPRNGERKPNKVKYVYEDRISFNCRTNFTLKGDRFVLCRETKDWTGTVPQCLAPCPDPGIPRGGHRYDHSFRHNNMVRFSCQRNWKMEGTHTIRCNNGRWDHKTPKCLEGCPRPNNRDNMYWSSRKDLYFNREEVRFTCYRGYKRVGYQRITCLNGKWSSDPPSCKRICSNPGRPNHGYISGFEFIEGKDIYFSCESGYDLFGSKTIRCFSNGRWNASRPECKRQCYNPRTPSNAATSNPSLVRGQRTKHSTTITFSCRPRYTLEGRQTIRCDDGRWSDSNVPVCKAPCSDPGPLQYGRKYGSNFLHGNQVTYTCSGMYILEGDTRLTCNNGHWDRPKPSCKDPCSNPGSPAKGNKIGSDYRHGKKVDYTCQRGTRLVGKSSLTCNNGRWSSTVPECLEICPPLKKLQNGQRIGKRESLSGDKVTFRCNSRFDLAGSAVLYCEQGQWNGSVPRCLGQCKVPDDYNVANVRTVPSVAARDWLYSGNILTFSCLNKTMELDGKEMISCNDGTWSEDFPKCKVPCNTNSGSVTNGRKQGTRFFVQYRCNIGYTLEGNPNITCVDGKWSSGPPKCLRGCFLSHPDPQNKNTDMYYGHGQKHSSNCNQGFRLNGSSVITCNEGVWSNDIPTCIGVCPSLNAPENGELLGNNFDYNARVRFRCNPGYDIRGPSERICSDGKWSGKQPVCRARCPDPGTPLNGRRRGNNFTHGMTVEFSCNNGSHLDGNQFIKCFNGIWSGSTPTCSGCVSALGMESKTVPDNNIRASSTRRKYHAKDGRLNGPRAWCSGSASQPYLEIDFGKPYRITGLATQGSAYDNKWVQSYVLESNLVGNSFPIYTEESIEKIFQGNRDSTKVVKQKIKKQLIARRIRINPIRLKGFSNNNPACMRVEVYGCDLPSDCILIGSRVVAKWDSHPRAGHIYYKAYLTSMSGRHWRVELENEKHGRDAQKHFLKYDDLPFVLDVPPKHEEVQVGTRVLAPWWHTYYESTIIAARDRYNRYRVKADDDDEKLVTIDQIRLIKSPTFCN